MNSACDDISHPVSCTGNHGNVINLQEPAPIAAAAPPKPEETIVDLARQFEREAARLRIAETTLKHGREDLERFEKNYSEAKETAGILADKLAARLGLPVR